MEPSADSGPAGSSDACAACDTMRRAVADWLDDVRAGLMREVDCLERQLFAQAGPAEALAGRLRWPTRQPPEPPLDPAPPEPWERPGAAAAEEPAAAVAAAAVASSCSGSWAVGRLSSSAGRSPSARRHAAGRHGELRQVETPKPYCYDTVGSPWGIDGSRRLGSDGSAEKPPERTSRRSSNGGAESFGSLADFVGAAPSFAASLEARSRLALGAPQPTMELHTLCCWAHVGERARAVFTWAHFDVIIGVVIVLNAITIGIETSASVGGEQVASFIQACEYVFMAVYIAELGLNFAALGVRESLRNPWIKLDIFFVVIGVANVALSVFTPDVGHPLGNFNMLKVLRLIRLARIIRLAVQFRTLWLLSCGLIHAVVPMIWTCFFMVVVIYVFAVLGMEMITDTRADRDNEYVVAAQNFNSIADAMLTLWQIMFVDSAASIYRPLMYNNPILILYFLAFFLMGPVALMNLVIAIMVESSFRVANEDQEAKRAWRTHKRKAMIPKLRELFKTMDLNGNDELDLEEIKANPAAMDQLKNIVDIDQLENLVHLLDQDQTGTISVDEFVEGLVRSCLDERPAELVLLVGHSRRILSAVRELGERRPDPSPGAPGGR